MIDNLLIFSGEELYPICSSFPISKPGNFKSSNVLWGLLWKEISISKCHCPNSRYASILGIKPPRKKNNLKYSIIRIKGARSSKKVQQRVMIQECDEGTCFGYIKGEKNHEFYTMYS